MSHSNDHAINDRPDFKVILYTDGGDGAGDTNDFGILDCPVTYQTKFKQSWFQSEKIDDETTIFLNRF